MAPLTFSSFLRPSLLCYINRLQTDLLKHSNKIYYALVAILHCQNILNTNSPKYVSHLSQARNQTFPEGGSKSGMVTHKISGSLIVSYCASTISMRSMLMLGGSGGMPPRKILKNRCSEIESGGILECLLAILYALISRAKYYHYNNACYRLTKAMVVS